MEGVNSTEIVPSRDHQMVQFMMSTTIFQAMMSYTVVDFNSSIFYMTEDEFLELWSFLRPRLLVLEEECITSRYHSTDIPTSHIWTLEI